MLGRGFNQRGDAVKTVVILFFGLVLGMVFMNMLLKFRLPKYRPKTAAGEITAAKKKQKKLKNIRLDTSLYKVEGKVKTYQERGLKFSSLTEAERFKTAQYYREIKKRLAYQDRERINAKKRFFKLGGAKLIEVGELLEKGKYDLAERIVKDVLRSGGKGDPRIRIESYRYLAEVYARKKDMEKYALMMYKYFDQLEKEGVSEEKEKIIAKNKEELKKVLERLKNR